MLDFSFGRFLFWNSC